MITQANAGFTDVLCLCEIFVGYSESKLTACSVFACFPEPSIR